MLCIYHVADSDGKGSGAIVRTVYPGIELMGLNHDMEIPYDEIRKHEKVVVCDFALPVDFMFELNEKSILPGLTIMLRSLTNITRSWPAASIRKLKGCVVSERPPSC